jgi:lipid II:glycine glycyltransferase (peptidoglycan interpeptide bridge formation enzyme)
MTVDLSTTNLLLGIMAVVSLLEGLVVIGIGVAGFMAYRRVMTLLEGLENRQVAPAMARLNSILDDVKGVTTKVKEETNRVDHAIHTTIGRIDDTADRVRANVRVNTSRLVGVIRGTRVAIDTFLNHHEETANRQQATSNM